MKLDQTPERRPGFTLLLGISLGWLVAVGVSVWLWVPVTDGALVALALILPLAMLWSSGLLLRNLSRQAAELSTLRAAITRLSTATTRPESAASAKLPDPALGRMRTEMQASQAAIEARLDTLLARQTEMLEAMVQTIETAAPQAPAPARPAPVTRAKPNSAAPKDQPDLPMDAALPDAALLRGDLILALNFPKDQRDGIGFEALRRAAKVREVAPLLQSAEDMLNQLSHLGIYTDDMPMALPDATLWRAFASGQRGPAVNGIARVEDEGALKKLQDQLRADPIIRDTALHFQRRFDQALERFAPEASDAELTAFADTRTARAFVMLGQISGTFALNA